MEFRLSFLIACCFILVNTALSAQIKAVNDKGEKIILYPDGSWKYDTEESETIDEESEAESDVASTLDIAEVRLEIEESYRITSSEYEASLKNENEEERILKEYQKEIEIEIKKGTFPKSKEEEKAHYEKLRNLKKSLKSAKQERKSKESLMKKQEKLLRLPPEKLAEGYLSYKSDLDGRKSKPSKEKKPKTESDGNPEISQAQEAFAKQLEEVKKQNEADFKSKLEAAKARSSALLARQDDENFIKPDLKCGMAFDEVDVFTGDRKRATRRSEFFTFTDPRMESMLRGKDFIKCEGFLSEVGKNKLLVLELQVRSKTARQEYGGIRKGAKVIIKMLDDEMVTLQSTTTDSGKYDIATGTYNFKGVYLIEKNQVKTLASKEINVLRIVWESGYEDYDIYEMDFIRNHFTCLKESKSRE